MTIRPFDIRASRRADDGAALGGAIRVLVVDDHTAVRIGLGGLLEDRSDMEVVATAASAREALADARRVAPDVAVVDFHLGDGDGLTLCRAMKRLPRPPRVLVYSAYADGPLTAAAVVAGADAVVSKGTLGEEVVRTIRVLAHGRRAFPPIPRAVQRSLRARLEPTDQSILGMLLQGITPSEIATVLRISPSRLESRRAAIMRAVMAMTPRGSSPEPALTWG
ncbi:MAG TPA: response regulator transcription factor [Thermoleophilaceae bacterium]